MNKTGICHCCMLLTSNRVKLVTKKGKKKQRTWHLHGLLIMESHATTLHLILLSRQLQEESTEIISDPFISASLLSTPQTQLSISFVL